MQILPKAVEKQAELADQLYQQAYGTPKEGTTPPAPAPAEPAPADSAQPTATDAKPSAPNEEPAAADDQSKPNDKPADEGGDLEHWKQRAKVAEGRLAKEMPRMAQSIRELKDQLNEANAKVQSLEAAKSSPPPSPIKPEEVEQYGQEFIDMVKRVARAENPGVDGDVKKQLEEVSERQRQVARQAFFAELNRDAPQWEQLNTDQNFLTWLSGLDPYTGRPRQELFDEAYEKLDAWRIANFFNTFGQSQQKEPEPTTPPPSRADQVVPNASKAGTLPPPAKRIWSTQDVARFYADVRRGAINEDEAARIEQDIFAAQADGRLR